MARGCSSAETEGLLTASKALESIMKPPRGRERIHHPTKGDYRWALAGVAGIAWLWSVGHGPGAFIQQLAFFWGIGVFFGFFERATRKSRREIQGDPNRAYKRYITRR